MVQLSIDFSRQISLAHNFVHDDLREAMPETVVAKTRMEHHGKRERALMDLGPPHPFISTSHTILFDNPSRPIIIIKVRVRAQRLARRAVPITRDHVRIPVDTLHHELVAHPALVAFRHIRYVDMITTRLIYRINVFEVHNGNGSAVYYSQTGSRQKIYVII